MKTYTSPITCLAFCAIILSLSLPSCSDKCEEFRSYTTLEPVYLLPGDMNIRSEAPRPLKETGKLYFKAPYIFISAPHEGIHVIDNSDVSNPQNIAFLNIIGSADLAIKGDILYTNNFNDLLAIDISDLHNISLVNRETNVFEEMYPFDPVNGFIVDWEEVHIEEIVDCTSRNSVLTEEVMFQDNTGLAPVEAPTVGVGGSMARFTIVNDFLYAVSNFQLKAYNITQANNPSFSSVNNLQSWNIETIYPFQGNLFIGSQEGMFIYSLSNPGMPSYVSEFAHINSCDPVVAEGDIAYVTLRSGTMCNSFTNQLEVLDISNIFEPQLIRTYPMSNPHGLGIDNGILFICDGDAGLKIYDATDANAIDQNQLAHYENINAFDVIPINNTLLMIGTDGLYQYNYTDINNIELLSTITIGE